MSTLPPYEQRQPNLGLASKDDVLKAAQNPDALFIDVRAKDEVEAAPFACCRFVHHSCTADSTEGLEDTVKPHIVSYDAPVIVFCRSGRRAMKAKETLEKMGCTCVYNAGGLEDLDYLSKENRSA
jgi:phage shock protein E